jgi:hypothetical protein
MNNLVKKTAYSLTSIVVNAMLLPFFIGVLLVLFIYKKIRKKNIKPTLLWGTDPIINNKYWSNSLREITYNSMTLMSDFYSINKKEDYDKYYNEILPFEKKLPTCLHIIFRILRPAIVLFYTINTFDIVHIPLHGLCLGTTVFWQLEPVILKLFNIKIIILPYGGDFYEYSNITDLSLRHVLLYNYPKAARNETVLAKKKRLWVKYADCIVSGYQTEGMGRWDILPFSFLVIDEKNWKPKLTYNKNDGLNGLVKISHSPNHRSIKATEFLQKAVNDLKEEGLNIELVLIEKMPNDYVKQLLENDIDIHAEQFIITGYAMSGIEGLACGLPVLANLDNEALTRVFRRFSFLNECPILSTTPELMKDNLRILITNPKLRIVLGKAGRKYVEKHHSYKASQFLFVSIYDKIWHKKEVDLMNLYHPLSKDSYNNQSPIIRHPLIENKLPLDWQVKIDDYLEI